MKKAKKILALLLCAVLLVGATVAGTVAYLTDKDDVTNTFTVGNVQIKLDEAVVDKETGKAPDLTNRTEDGNEEVRMIPGRTIDKDPTVTVLKDSEDCYVRVKVTVDLSESWTSTDAVMAAWGWDETEGFDKFLETWAGTFAGNYLATGNMVGFNTVNWNVAVPVADRDAKTITYILNYKTDTNNIFKKNSGTNKDTDGNMVLEAIFTKVSVPQNLTNAQLALLEGMEIKVEAHAIQAEGFVAADEKTAEQNAWGAFGG